MAASDFQSRWAKKKTQDAEFELASPSAAPIEPATKALPKEPQPLPTLEDVAKLSVDSDYSVFVAKGVDENVKRSAMKKLFTDPHFNIMDRLDIYIDDYTKPDPIPPEMLALLDHAKSVLNPLKHLESPAMRMISREDLPPADQSETARGEETALEESGDTALNEAESNPLPKSPDTAAVVGDPATDPLADASRSQVAGGDGTDESESDTVADTMDPADHARQNESHTGAEARPDAKP